MFPLTTLVLLPMCSVVLGDISGSEYDVTPGCDLIYGNILETLNDSRSITECSGQCSRRDHCISVKYNPTTNVCQLNSEYYISLSINCQEMFRYAKLVKRSGRKWINENCMLSEECLVMHSQCYLNNCQCKLGYSYRRSTESCVESCDFYGSTFTVYQNYGIGGNDDKFVNDAYTSDVCERACAEETSFICLSSEHIDTYCTILRTSARTNPDLVQPNLLVDYYHRNCQ